MRTWGGSGCQERERERDLLSDHPPPCAPVPSQGMAYSYLPLFCGTCYLASGDGDHVRVDSQAERREEMGRCQWERAQDPSAVTCEVTGSVSCLSQEAFI